jgi:hypothetical protein
MALAERTKLAFEGIVVVSVDLVRSQPGEGLQVGPLLDSNSFVNDALANPYDSACYMHLCCIPRPGIFTMQ